MTSRKHTAKIAIALLLTCTTVQAGGRLHHHGPECNTLGVPCGVKRPTYGYTPTTWRRWPDAPQSAIPSRTVEELPTPAKEPRPTVEPDAPLMTPEEPPLVPSESEPPVSPPSADPVVPPFEQDAPPSPPAQESETPVPEGEAPPADTAPPLDSLFDAPSSDAAPSTEPTPTIEGPPSAEEAPPTMPDDDPFKDDPAAPAPPDEAPKGGSLQTEKEPVQLGRTETSNWSAASGKPRAIERTSDGPELIPYNASEPPQRLAKPARDVEPQRVRPASSIESRNPLRSSPAKSVSKSVVPASHWEAEPVAPRPRTTTELRKNPLR